MANLRDLAQRLNGMAKDASETANERAKLAARAILRELIEITPVYTTKALSNWQVGIGGPPSGPIGAYFPGILGYTTGESSAAALRVGNARINAKKPGEVLYISNATPYIGELNRGSSKQAPAGFVERALLVGKTAARVRLK